MQKQIKKLLCVAIGVRCLTVLSLLLIPCFLPAFDASASQVLTSKELWLEGFLRWDTLYFIKIAKDGYTREQEFAFMPALPWLLRKTGRLGARLFGNSHFSITAALIATSLLANIATVIAVILSYLSVNLLPMDCTHVYQALSTLFRRANGISRCFNLLHHSCACNSKYTIQ